MRGLIAPSFPGCPGLPVSSLLLKKPLLETMLCGFTYKEAHSAPPGSHSALTFSFPAVTHPFPAGISEVLAAQDGHGMSRGSRPSCSVPSPAARLLQLQPGLIGTQARPCTWRLSSRSPLGPEAPGATASPASGRRGAGSRAPSALGCIPSTRTVTWLT